MAEYIIQDTTVTAIGDALKDRSKFIPPVPFRSVPSVLAQTLNRPVEHYKYYGIAEDRSVTTTVNREYFGYIILRSTESTDYGTSDGESWISWPVSVGDIYYINEDGETIPTSLPDGSYSFVAARTYQGSYKYEYRGTDSSHYDAEWTDTGVIDILEEGQTYYFTVDNSHGYINTEKYGYSTSVAEANGVWYLNNCYETLTVLEDDFFVDINTVGTEKITTTEYILKFSGLDFPDESELSTKTIRTAASESAEIVNYTDITKVVIANAIELTTSKLYPNGWYYINYESPKAFDYVEFRVMFDGADVGVCCHAKVTLPKNSENSIICYPDIYGGVDIPKGTIQATVYPIENNQLRVELDGHYLDYYGDTVVLQAREYICNYVTPLAFKTEEMSSHLMVSEYQNSYTTYN